MEKKESGSAMRMIGVSRISDANRDDVNNLIGERQRKRYIKWERGLTLAQL